MTANEAMREIMNAGYEGAIEFASETDGEVTIRFWNPLDKYIPVETIKRMAAGTRDPKVEATLTELLKWWQNDRGQYTDYF